MILRKATLGLKNQRQATNLLLTNLLLIKGFCDGTRGGT